MAITPSNPFKGRHFTGEASLVCVRWCLRYPLAYEHVAELLAERGVEVDPVASAVGAGLRTRAQQTLPSTSETDEQKLPHGRDLHKG